MQGRLLHLICRRLYSSTSQLSSLRRFSSSSEEASTENLSIFNKEIPTQHRKQRKSYKQNPSENFTSGPNSDSLLNPNSNPICNPIPNPNPQYNPNLEHNSNPNIVPNPRIYSNTNPSSDASLPDDKLCIWAVERLSRGRKYSSFDRNRERVPGYVWDEYLPDEKHVLIAMDKFQIQSLWFFVGEERFMRTVFTLEVFDGFGSDNILYRQPVLPRRINFDVTGKICNVGYLLAPPGKKLRLDVPIRISGQEDCAGLKKGGLLKVHLSYASLFCLPEELPPYVDIHVNEMDIGDRICLEDLRIGVPLHSNNQPSLTICEII